MIMNVIKNKALYSIGLRAQQDLEHDGGLAVPVTPSGSRVTPDNFTAHIHRCPDTGVVQIDCNGHYHEMPSDMPDYLLEQEVRRICDAMHATRLDLSLIHI